MKIFYDVDTQNDFMNKDGALYVPDAELIKPNLAELTKFARKNIIPIAGSLDKHFGTEEYKAREGELQRWGGPFPDHCMDGTKGQEKIHGTLIVDPTSGYKCQIEYRAFYIPNILRRNVEVGEILANENIMTLLLKKDAFVYTLDPQILEVLRENFRKRVSCGEPSANFLVKEFIEGKKTGLDQYILNWAVDIIQETQYKIPLLANRRTRHAIPVLYHRGAVYFEKQSYDVFTNPAMEKVLEMAGVKEAVVYGVATDYCVKAAVVGMQKRGVQCYVVEDAIKGVAPETTEAALEEMKKAGARFVKTNDVLEEIVR